MSNTPETDACIIERRKIHKSDGSVQLVELIDAKFARRLERERYEARESAAKWEAVALREASINGARICAKEDAK